MPKKESKTLACAQATDTGSNTLACPSSSANAVDEPKEAKEPERGVAELLQSDGASTTDSESSGFQEPRPTIDNPFEIYSWRELDQVIETTVRGLKLEWWTALIQRGARLARDCNHAKKKLKEDGQLSGEDEAALEMEENGGFWAQASQPLIASLLVASLGGIIQGWTQSVINGSTIGIAHTLNLHVYTSDPDYNMRDVWKLSILSAMPGFAGGLISPFIADWLQMRYLGRRGGLMIAVLITIASTIGACFAKNYYVLLVMRLLNGVALASKASIVTIYSSELAPWKIRGSILANWQVADALGIALGFVCVIAIIGADLQPNLSWRLMTLTPIIPTLVLFFLIYPAAVESPHWYLKMQRPVDAFRSFKKIRKSDLLGSKDFIYTQAQLDVEARLTTQRRQDARANRDGYLADHTLNDRLQRANESDPEISAPAGYLYEMQQTSFLTRVKILFGDPICRRALIASSWSMLTQILTGVNCIAYLLFSLLKDNNASDLTAAWIGLGFGIINFCSGLPAYWLEDRVGRASLMLIGLPNTAWLMLVLALCFLIDQENPARTPAIAIAIVAYTAVYSFTTGPSCFAVASEVFPLSVREVGMAAGIMVNYTACGFNVLLFPSITKAMGSYAGSLSFAAALNIVAWIGVFFLVPETRGRTLEELQFTFDLPIRKHIEFRCSYVCPKVWKKYVLRQEVGEIAPFYRWARRSSE